MGGGEMVWRTFYDWYAGLTDEVAADYARRNPEPGSWDGNYVMMRKDWQDEDG